MEASAESGTKRRVQVAKTATTKMGAEAPEENRLIEDKETPGITRLEKARACGRIEVEYITNTVKGSAACTEHDEDGRGGIARWGKRKNESRQVGVR